MLAQLLLTIKETHPVMMFTMRMTIKTTTTITMTLMMLKITTTTMMTTFRVKHLHAPSDGTLSKRCAEQHGLCFQRTGHGLCFFKWHGRWRKVTLTRRHDHPSRAHSLTPAEINFLTLVTLVMSPQISQSSHMWHVRHLRSLGPQREEVLSGSRHEQR